MKSTSNLDQTIYQPPPADQDSLNFIKQTRKMIKNMSQSDRFWKAKCHINDALKYKRPRPECGSPEITDLFNIVYIVNTSWVWDWLLFICSYIFVYLVILDNESYNEKIIFQAILLFIILVDIIMQFYIKSFNKFKTKNKYQKPFIAKAILIILMIVDLIIFISYPCYGTRPVRPFRILRAFVPMIYEPEFRKAMHCIWLSYKDIIVFMMFMIGVAVIFALIGNAVITYDPNYVDPVFPQGYTPFAGYRFGYNNLSHMIFFMYVEATYDDYPDNEIPAAQYFLPNYIFFIVFIFLNMFLFTTIPSTIFFHRFRQNRSKMILVDEIRQQDSLILAFVTLAENENNLSLDKLVKFLLYLYRYKIRYIDYITEICMKLDQNNSKSIQINQFMQLSNILLYNTSMLPPSFDDLSCWIQFRHFLNNKLNLKAIVTFWLFQFIVSILIILCFVNSLYLIYQTSPLNEIFDTTLICIFIFQLLLRIIAIGPENFFANRWNNLDTFLMVFSFSLLFVSNNYGINGAVRMSRIFRIASLARLISHSDYLKDVKFDISEKLKRLITNIFEIAPIAFKYFQIFSFFFFIFNILGMEIFYGNYNSALYSDYNGYSQFSNFYNFVYALLFQMQVLTEGGWSTCAFDFALQNADYYGIIMIFFCLNHFFVVFLTANLLKGIFWEIYFVVTSMYAKREEMEKLQLKKQQQNKRKTDQINEISDQIAKNISIQPNTVIKRQLIEKKSDREILLRLSQLFHHQKQRRSQKNCKNRRSRLVEMMMDQRNISKQQISEQLSKKVENNHKKARKRKKSLNEIEELANQDFEEYMEEMLNYLIINPKMKCTQIVAYPKIFVDYLNQKFQIPEAFISDSAFHINKNPISNEKSIFYHTDEIRSILGIQNSKRQQKAMIIDQLVQDRQITYETAQKLITKKLHQSIYTIQSNGALRKTYLDNTNPYLITKFQVQYFSDRYGHSFRQINKLTLEPLLRLEASLTYSLRNILRYPQIDNVNFFEMFTTFEDRVSNKLLKRGSLFKFVYKIDHQSDIWFSIQCKQNQQLQIHFIKTGLWAFTKNMQEDQIYYARDIFNWDCRNRQDKKICEQYIKLFYENFQTLAFSLIDSQNFFKSDPKSYIYDLYIDLIDVRSINRYWRKNLQISKIMMIILSKEDERCEVGQSDLTYEISEIAPKIKQGKITQFTFDESDNETFEKLKNLAAIDDEKILETEGLPFAYIINFMKEINDVSRRYTKNFIHQIQKVLNDEFNQVKIQETQQIDPQRISLNVVEDKINV